MQAFEVGREEERCGVEFGEGGWGFDDGVAEAFENGAVERVEDGVLEDDVLHGVFSGYGSGLASDFVLGEQGCKGVGNTRRLYGWA